MEFSLREFTDALCRVRTTAGREAELTDRLRARLDSLDFETYAWAADAERLAGHPSFPSDLDPSACVGRESVAGVLEFGDPDAGPTLVLNGHTDVVPAGGEWETDPFEPVRRDDGAASERLTCRGAVDMKSGLAACVGAALDVREAATELDGRLVVEAVAGEEDGGFGAATAAMENPYPFERTAAIVAEPTGLTPVVACEGSLMARLELTGRSAHAATPWYGEDVLPRFERIRRAFAELEAERGTRVSHPLYGEYDRPWPVVAGRVAAGDWPSTVPAELEAEFRIGVAPGETVTEVQAAFEKRLAAVVAEDEWLVANPPRFERFSVQFEPSEIDPDEPVVRTLREAMAATGVGRREPRGATYGTDARHYVAAGIPTVLFGPGSVRAAHFPNETIEWQSVRRARETLAATAERFLRSGAS